MAQLDHVDYDSLDNAKNSFIAASKKSLSFAKKYGFIPEGRLGASANIFALDLKPFLKSGSKQLYVTLLPEGLGTADDAKPNDLTEREALEFWYNIGIKTVSVTTNDAASSGIQTILLSLYLPSSTPELVFNKTFLKGFLDGFLAGCREVGCVYFSGETPQLKTKIYPGKIDIAGALWGVSPPGKHPIDGSKLRAGNFMVFVESTGPNENGFTSLRDLADHLPQGYRTRLPSGQEYWQAINNRSVLYTPLVQDILKAGIVPTNIEPITGHGWQKIMRSKNSLRYIVEKMLPVPEIFTFIEKHSQMSPADMVKIFNYGLGMVIFVESEVEAEKVIKAAKGHRLRAIVAGRVEKSRQREVVIESLGLTLGSEEFLLQQ
jgi:phosphoribosylformylglycinamidine cyclo-ligase